MLVVLFICLAVGVLVCLFVCLLAYLFVCEAKKCREHEKHNHDDDNNGNTRSCCWSNESAGDVGGGVLVTQHSKCLAHAHNSFA